VLLRLFFRVLLSRIRPIPEQVERIHEMAKRGTVVYVLKGRSGLESLLYHYQSRRLGLPVPVFACDSNMMLFHSPGFFFKTLLRGLFTDRSARSDPYSNGFVDHMIRSGKSIILYLQDMDAFERRFLRLRRDPFINVLETQQSLGRPIIMVPQMVIWDRAQERTHPRLDELLLGQRSNPSGLRVMFNFLRFYRRMSYISQAEPVDAKAFLEARRGMDLRAVALDLRKELLARLQRERRLVIGPVARSRQEIMERVLFDERVQQAIKRRVSKKGKSEKAVRKEAYRLLKEIATDFDPAMLRYWNRVMNWVVSHLYDGLEVDKEGLEKVREAARHSNLVMVPCHRSHMDYMILAYVFYNNYLFPPFIAAGLNLAFWPMGFVFRKSGAFFIRRDFRGSVLYPAVFTRYLRVLLEQGYPLEFFIEGGRSRSGKMIMPKLGFLSLLMDGYRAGACKDISFVPVAISYDRIMEEGAYLREMEGGEKVKESFRGMLRSRKVFRKHYGKIYVTFNEPVSIKTFLTKTLENPNSRISYTRHNIPYYLAYEIAQRINRVMVVVPTALVAAAILCSPSARGFTPRQATVLAHRFVEVLREEGAYFSSSLNEKDDLSESIRETMEFFQKERLIQGVKSGRLEADEEEEAFYEIQDRNRRRLDYYKNTILLYLLPYAFVSASLLVSKRTPVPADHIAEETVFLKDLFREEFVFLPEEDLESKIKLTLERMCTLGLIKQKFGGFVIATGRRQDLLGFARLIQSYFESYFVVGSSLKHIAKRRLSQRWFLWRMRFTGHRLYQTGRIQLPESLSQMNYMNAIQYLVDQKIILRQVDKTFREGTYFSLIPERRKTHWRRIKTYLGIFH
jgi:glycerol-3-phosphate O-acyltransferase